MVFGFWDFRGKSSCYYLKKNILFEFISIFQSLNIFIECSRMPTIIFKNFESFAKISFYSLTKNFVNLKFIATKIL